MSVPFLLIGIAIAACLCADLAWSAYRAVTRPGYLRIANIVKSALMIAAMAALSAAAAVLASWLGTGLMLAALVTMSLEKDRARHLSLAPFCLGLALHLGLPFAAP